MHNNIKYLYQKGYSSQEIKNILNLSISVRQIQRIVKYYGLSRTVAESYLNAIQRNRIVWKYKKDKIKRHKISPKIRFIVLQRDNFTCVLCGSKDILEIDHIDNDKNNSVSTNLQTLCHLCNQGKYLINQ